MQSTQRSFALGSTVAVAVAVLGLCASSAHAYNPPVDTAGPLSVRIEGPGEVTETDVPLPVRVVLENKGTAAIEGTVELGLVDRWRAEPAGPVAFSAPAGGTATREFTVVAGRGTYSAHYPIHAYARFESDGKSLTAHPILILQTKLPAAPRAPIPLEWKPLEVPQAGQLALWRLPVHRAVIEVFGEEPKQMPVGWQGSEPRCHGSLFVGSATLECDTRSVLGIHPPWSEGLVGTLAVEFPLELPEGEPLALDFATGITPTGQSDGVTFRVRVLPLDAPAGQLGKVVFERHSDAKSWQPGRADLSQFAGQAVRLQFESHPGPQNNTGWDQSYWAEPTLSAGTLPEPPAFPPEDDDGSIALGTATRGDARYDVRLWPGRRGLLDAVVGFRQGDRRLFFRGFEVRVLGGRIDDTRSPILLQEVKQEPSENGYQVRHAFQSLFGTFDLVGRLYVERGVLRATFHLENTPEPQPWHVVYLEDVAAGPWSESARQVYAGHGNVVRDPEAFRLGFDGHRLATSFVGIDFSGGLSMVQGSDVPPSHLQVEPADRHYSLHVPHASTLTFIPAQDAWEGARQWREVNGLEAAGGVPRAAGRFVFDLWGGRYGESTEALELAFRYGLTDSMVIWHNWQRWGYDYRLPNIYPPNPRWGTLDEMLGLIDTCKQAGVPIALHDNYIDFYPDADGFSYEENVAFGRDGTPVKAWLNEGRDARSYRYRADRAEPYLKRNLELIRDRLAPTAYFIDVWSSIGPYDYWTADGRFFDRVGTRTTWGELFAWIRDLLGDGAPQISESGHDQLIGWLDGAQTNHLRIGTPMPGRRGWCVLNWRCGDAERTPWFDAAHHDRFILHGAGYPSRYEGGLDPRLHGIYSDDYISTEVLTGHPGMVPRPFNRDVVRKYWLLGRLMRALALRQIEGVEFAGDDLHRQHVRWSGGGEVWVNRGESDWEVAGTILPQYGFLARVPTDEGPVEASISRRDGVIVEIARVAGELYVNGRQVVDPALPIRLGVERVKLIEGRRFEMAFTWQVDVPIPDGYRPFLHFCDTEGEIVSQAGQPSDAFDKAEGAVVSTPAWGEMPGSLPAGESLELRMGLYNPSGGQRLRLAGPDDGTRRIRIGSIRLEADGDRVTGITWTPHRPEPDPLLARQNTADKPIDFGPVTTVGGCRITRNGGALVVTPLPGDRVPEFTVRLNPAKLGWGLAEPTHVESVAEDGRVLTREPVGRDGDDVLITCRGGVFRYRLVRATE